MRTAGLLILLAAPAAAQSLHYEGSAGLATGTYIFTERTSSWNIATGLALGAGPVTFRASLPVFYQSSSLVAATGGGYVPTGGSASGSVADSSVARSGRGTSRRTSVISPSLVGVDSGTADPVTVPTSATGYRWAAGDPLLSASLSGLRAGPLGVIVGVSAKVPVVDTASLGTGAWDVGGSLSASVLLGAQAMLSLDAAYWHLGDPPGLDLSDPFVFGGTVSWLGGRWGLSAGIAGSTPTIAGFAAPVSVTASVLRLGSVAGLGILATAGLTETAPDVSVALTWRFALVD